MTAVETERYEADTTPDPPPTPSGYAEPYLFEYSTVALFASAVPVGLLSFGGFGWLLWRLQDPAVFASVFTVTETAEGVTFALDVLAVLLPFVLALVVVVVGHELVHGAVLRYYGREVTYGVNAAMGAFYSAAFGQFQDAEELGPVAVAPLVVGTLVVTPLLLVPVPVVAVTAFFVLTINTTGSVGDLYLLWRLRRLPEGTLLYDADLRHWYVFEPLEETLGGAARRRHPRT